MIGMVHEWQKKIHRLVALYGKYDLKKFEDEYYQFDLSYKETQICTSNNDPIYDKDIVYP